MKRVMGPLLASILGLLFYSVPVHAQYANLPNQAAWNQYLANHPQTAAELRADPSLISSSNWRSQHRDFESWANSHPEDWKALRKSASSQNRYETFDKDNNQSHGQNWWYHHKPEWADQNHSDWWQDHRDSKSRQGEQRAEEKGEHAGTKEQHADENYRHHQEHDYGGHGDHGPHGDPTDH
jgi:hypothetical protein